MTSNVPRDPEHYWPTEHAVLRKRKRGVEWNHVSTAIKQGRLHNKGENDTCVFTYLTDEGLLYVSTNHESGAITTVAWYDE